MNAAAFKKTDRPMVDVIEQYLKEAEKEAKSFQLGNEDYRSFFEFESGENISFDQQVPQMLTEESEVMLTESIKANQPTDFLAEELSSIAGPVPVYVSSETALQHNERSDYYDLDQVNSSPTNLGSQELSFYHCDEFCSYNRNTKNNSEIISQYNQSEECHIPVKREPLNQEPFDDLSQSQCNDCEYDMLEQHDQMTHLYIEDMRKLINDHNVQDVQTTCKCLHISPDPAQWSNNDVRDWVIWQCRQYHIECPNLDYFNMTGAEFSNLTEDMFKFAAPQAGQVLCARLIVWRSVVEQTTAYSDYVPQITQIPIPTSPSLTTSSHGSVSPTPSAWSEESQHEEPVQHFKVPATKNDDCLPEEPVHHHRQTIQLWQFLKLLLLDPSGNFTDCIRWLDRPRGIFKIENSSRVAKLWGKRKNRPAMNYDKLSRSIRQYYKKGIITKTETTKRLVYQFCKP